MAMTLVTADPSGADGGRSTHDEPDAHPAHASARRLRVRPWQGDDRVAHIAPRRRLLGPLTADDVRRALERAAPGRLPGRAHRRAAPGRPAAVPRGGLRRDRAAPPAAPRRSTELSPTPAPAGLRHAAGPAARPRRGARGRPRRLRPVLAARPGGLDEALGRHGQRPLPGGPRQRTGIVGYAVCGRAGHRGYVQRLAVDPAVPGPGRGRRAAGRRAALAAALGRPRRARSTPRRATTRSLRLYQRAGFVLQPDGLAVLALSLGDAGVSTRPLARGAGSAGCGRRPRSPGPGRSPPGAAPGRPRRPRRRRRRSSWSARPRGSTRASGSTCAPVTGAPADAALDWSCTIAPVAPGRVPRHARRRAGRRRCTPGTRRSRSPPDRVAGRRRTAGFVAGRGGVGLPGRGVYPVEASSCGPGGETSAASSPT